MAASKPVSLPASASGQVGPQDQGELYYVGFSVCETASAAAAIRVRANGSLTGDILDTISLVADESTGDNYDHPRRAGSGIYIELVSGTMPEGSVFIL
jgi:hypothetical protein